MATITLDSNNNYIPGSSLTAGSDTLVVLPGTASFDRISYPPPVTPENVFQSGTDKIDVSQLGINFADINQYLLSGRLRLTGSFGAIDLFGVTTTLTATDFILGGPPDLAVTKSVSANPANPGQPLTYTLLVSNTGASSVVTVTDDLPDNLTGITVTAPTGFTSSVTATGNTVTISGGTVAQGNPATITITATAPNVGGNITNIASVTPATGETNLTNNAFTLTTSVAPTPVAPNFVIVDDDWAGRPIGATVSVDPDGPTGNLPEFSGIIGQTAFAVIEQGINAVAPGGTVQVASGTYQEGIMEIIKPVILRGPNEGESGSGARFPEATLTGNILQIDIAPEPPTSSVTLDGFLIIGPITGSAGPVVNLTDGGNGTTIQNNIFRNLDLDAIYGVAPSGSSTSVTNVNILNNLFDTITGTGRRAIYLQSVNGATIQGNTVQNLTGGDNPGILLDTVSGTVLITNNTLNNIASQGIQIAGVASGSVTISSNTLTAVNVGPDGNPNTMDNQQVQANSAIRVRNSPPPSAAGTGTGINGIITIVDNIINNSFNGLVLRPKDGGISDNTQPNASQVTVQRNRFGVVGGSLAVINGGTPDLTIPVTGANANFRGDGITPLNSFDVGPSTTYPIGSASFPAANFTNVVNLV